MFIAVPWQTFHGWENGKQIWQQIDRFFWLIREKKSAILGKDKGKFNPFNTKEQNNYSWGQKLIKTHLFWTFLFHLDIFIFIFIYNAGIFSGMWLLCRASCCLEESYLSDKYCHYAVIYPFTIRASSLIRIFMDLLTKKITLCCFRCVPLTVG